MLLLIGGGGLGLCAIIAVAIWLMMGSGDTPETAKSDSTPPAQTTPAATTPPKGKDPEVPPRENPTPPPPAPAAENWQPFSVDGFTVEVPGTPQPFNPGATGGVPMKMFLHQLPGQESGFLVLAMSLPVDVSNDPVATRKMFDGFETGFSKGSGGGFGAPGFGQFGRKQAKMGIGSRSPITVDGHKGMEFGLTDQSPGGRGGGTVRVVIAGRKVFIYCALSDNFAAFSGDAQRFIGSAKIDFPPGPVAVAPVPAPTPPPMPPMPGTPFPGGPPMPPMPGVDPGMSPPGGFGFPGNQPPPGAETSPSLAGRVEPFFAIAFDPEKGEVYTVAPRMSSGKTYGTLRRYSYPDFRPKGQWKVPHMATRAVLNPKTGLLYLATAGTSPNPLLMAQLYDHAAAVGDVEVIDLAPIRAGKVEELADVKAATVIPANTTIRGLDLSPDGTRLYLVTRSSGAKPKSFARVFDTADRKQIKEKELPETAWAARLSADGKQLLVIEYPPAVPRALNVLALDADTLSSRAHTVPVPGGVSDIAAGPGGCMVAAVGTATGSKLFVLGGDGNNRELTAPGWKAAQNGYAEFTPDGKYLFVASHCMANAGQVLPGFDVYEVADPADPKTYKKVASIRKAGDVAVGGYFHVSPDGAHVVFHTGAVLMVDKLTENTGGPAPPPGGAFPAPPAGGFNPPPGAAPPPPAPGAAPPAGGGVGGAPPAVPPAPPPPPANAP
jgi:hypothetical protein